MKNIHYSRNVLGKIRGDSLDYDPAKAEAEIEAAKEDDNAEVTNPSEVTTVIKYKDDDGNVTETVVYTTYTKLAGS